MFTSVPFETEPFYVCRQILPPHPIISACHSHGILLIPVTPFSVSRSLGPRTDLSLQRRVGLSSLRDKDRFTLPVDTFEVSLTGHFIPSQSCHLVVGVTFTSRVR